MGMYTELIFGAGVVLTTKEINILKFMMEPKNDPATAEKPADYPFKDNRCSWMFNSGGSYYFGANSGEFKLEVDDTSHRKDPSQDKKFCRLNLRFNIKNYDNEIEEFLKWIHPFVEQGSGIREFYAIVTYEEAEKPTIYYLFDKDGNKYPEATPTSEED